MAADEDENGNQLVGVEEAAVNNSVSATGPPDLQKMVAGGS